MENFEIEIEQEVLELAKNKTIKDIKDMMPSSKLFDINRVEELFGLDTGCNELFYESHEELIDFVKNELEVSGRTIEHINIQLLDKLSELYINKLNEDVQSFAFNFEMDNVCN